MIKEICDIIDQIPLNIVEFLILSGVIAMVVWTGRPTAAMTGIKSLLRGILFTLWYILAVVSIIAGLLLIK